ncbi:hypothetical protein KGF54_003110 [Candida jiufengensis]|uniref:uncharacterized protein n=1 Tax=Candida jiufengensis TaxID=497108 RepID=UPI0022253143|nr:uncharacterized protein KGF54_003110 [Candida jiufengensis]KAI5952244.1 hypothetical protein KGF54_003110 [Candida jiufengensis]
MTDKTTDSTTTALLIEHFGFAPLKLIDEVINAINQITGKGIEALEEYLLNLQNKQKLEATQQTTDEIFTGSAKLESLLQFKIDIFFDKFELYSLGNIFHIPQDLVDDGLIKLKHHEGIHVETLKSIQLQKDEYDFKILQIYELIEKELIKRKLYNLQIVKCEKILSNLRTMKSQLLAINNLQKDGEKSSKDILRNLKPIDETLEFFYNQLKLIILQIETLNTKLDSKPSNTASIHKFSMSSRNKFIDLRMKKIMNDLNLKIPTPPPSPPSSNEENEEKESASKEIDEDIEVDTDYDVDLKKITDLDVMKQIMSKVDTS